MKSYNLSLFENQRMSLEDSVSLSLSSLSAYGERYKHWAVAYSGGKDSTATVTFVAWAIKNQMVEAPESLTVLYADTRMELPPLNSIATRLLDNLREDFSAIIVRPELDERFFIYMLGRGVPPPKNNFRWCTSQLKIKPMMKALQELRENSGEKLLMLTGVRIGESASRDQRIALSCSRNSGECGQGWFQISTKDSVADTLAPLLHWRLCHVYDWLYIDDRHGYDVHELALIYGEEDVRTGCIACNLASRDTALERLIKNSAYYYLKPLLELRGLYSELKKPQWRKRKARPELLQDGINYGKNVQRLGPFTMKARSYGLSKVLDIQKRSYVNLIDSQELMRIHELWEQNTWPRKWSEEDITGDVPINAISIEGNNIVYQDLLI